MKVKILSPAELELKDAYEFYQLQLEGLGSKFLESFLQTVDLVNYHRLRRWLDILCLEGTPLYVYFLNISLVLIQAVLLPCRVFPATLYI